LLFIYRDVHSIHKICLRCAKCQDTRHAFELFWPMALAELCKAWVYSSLLAGVAGSNPARGTDICLLWALCVVR